MTDIESDLPSISVPADRALAEAGYTRLDQLTEVTPGELLKLHGVGPLVIRRLQEVLAQRGATFADG